MSYKLSSNPGTNPVGSLVKLNCNHICAYSNIEVHYGTIVMIISDTIPGRIMNNCYCITEYGDIVELTVANCSRIE